MFMKYPPGDYQIRLHNTLVVYDGWPVNLQVMGGDQFALQPVHPASTFKARNIKANDPKLDISTPPLGWSNILDNNGERYVVYLVREPVRRFAQGLNSKNTTAQVLTSKGLSRQRDPVHYMYSEGFEKLIRGDYPTLNQCFSALESGAQAMAVNRNIALLKKKDVTTVYFKLDEVGYITPGTRTVHVPHEENSRIISQHLSCVDWIID